MSTNDSIEFDPRLRSDALSIVIMEGRRSSFDALAELLSADHCDCRFCGDLKGALVEIGRARPDIVLLNPDVAEAGLEDFFRSLQDDSRTKRLPVLVLSSRRDAATRKRIFEFGASDFIIKPIEAVELVSRVRRNSRLHRFELEQEALNERLEAAVQARTRELKEANEKLHELNERISAMDRSKTSMLSSISHELRTPANGFFGAANLILEDVEEQVDSELLEAFRESERRLKKLMEDAYQLIALRREQDDEMVGSQVFREQVETILFEAPIQSELDVDFKDEACEAEVSRQLFSLALKKLLAVGDGFAVEDKMFFSVAKSGPGLEIRLKVPGVDLAEEKLAIFFDDFGIDESDVPRGSLGLQPTVAREAVLGMGGELTVAKSDRGICFEMKLEAKAASRNRP